MPILWFQKQHNYKFWKYHRFMDDTSIALYKCTHCDERTSLKWSQIIRLPDSMRYCKVDKKNDK